MPAGGNSLPFPNTHDGWAALSDRLETEALANRLAIPLLFGADAIHGFGNVLGATVFPHNTGLGSACDPDLMEQIGTIAASEMVSTLPSARARQWPATSAGEEHTSP